MSDIEYVGGNTNQGFMTQDLIRTVNLSFQPYLPFSQYYSMMLREANDPERANYFRFGPPDVNSKLGTASSDSTYPFRLRRELFGGDASNATGKITNVATKNPNRIGQMQDAFNNTKAQAEGAELAKELATLLNVSYAFDSQSFVDENYTSESQRDAHELEVGMLSRHLDEAFGSKYTGTGITAGPMRDKNTEFTYTDKTGKGFDMILSQYKSMNTYMEHLFGTDYDDSIDLMDVSSGEQAKAFFQIGDTKGLSEAEVMEKILTRINSQIDKYNKKIRTAIAPYIKGAQEEMGHFNVNLIPAYLLAEMARETGKQAKYKGGPDYMVRQIMHRFALNSFRPYYFQGQISADSFAIFVLTPELHGNIPQIAPVTDETMRYVTTSGTIIGGLKDFMITIQGVDSKILAEKAGKASKLAAARSVATKATLESVGRYSMASVGLQANNELEVVLRDEGLDSIHKMSFEISSKLLKDIRSYYSSGKMTMAFKDFYDKMMRKANDLTRQWYGKAKGYDGVRGKPISAEWRAPTFGWSGADGYKKKGIGVWGNSRTSAWKDGMGRNFSVAPFMEARRNLSGGLQSSSFDRSYNDPL